MTHRQLAALCSWPCSSSSGGPVPASRYWVLIPSTVTRRSRIATSRWSRRGGSGCGSNGAGVELSDMELPWCARPLGQLTASSRSGANTVALPEPLLHFHLRRSAFFGVSEQRALEGTAVSAE